MRIAMYGEQVTALREERRMTQRHLAAEANVSVTTARRAEHGQPVMVKTARKVAAALRVHPPQSLGRVIRGA